MSNTNIIESYNALINETKNLLTSALQMSGLDLTDLGDLSDEQAVLLKNCLGLYKKAETFSREYLEWQVDLASKIEQVDKKLDLLLAQSSADAEAKLAEQVKESAKKAPKPAALKKVVKKEEDDEDEYI